MRLRMRQSLRAFGLASAAVAGFGLGASDLARPDDASARDTSPTVVWGGTTHTTRQSLEAWLDARGLSYRAWAYKHPIAAFRLDQAAERAERAATRPSASTPPSPEQRVSTLLLALVVVFGLTLGGVAIVLSPAPVRFHPSLRFVSDRRAYIALVGAGCVAVAAASYAAQI